MANPLISEENLIKLKKWLGNGSINIFGLPYAGKDTNGRILSDLLDAPLIGGGDILRNSILPPNVKKDLDSGKLIPTDDYVRIVLPYLNNNDLRDKPLILSSVGRWIGEEEGVLKATEQSGHETKVVVYLYLSENALRQRWDVSQREKDRNNRADDAHHAIQTRIDEFYTKTLPVIEVYKQKNLLLEVNSDATKQEVIDSIISGLLNLAN